MGMQEELNEFINKVNAYAVDCCPPWLTPNSTFFGVIPGSNLDLLQISFDYKVDRYSVLKAEGRDFLQDPEKPEMRVIK